MRTGEHADQAQLPTQRGGRAPGGSRAALADEDRATCDAAFARLARELFDPAVAGPVDLPGLVALVCGPPHPDRARVAFALGAVLADGGRPYLSDQVRALVRAELDALLGTLLSGEAESALRRALLHLLAQLPEERARIMPAVLRGADEADAARMRRCLADSPADPESDLGRGWPSPAGWEDAAPPADLPSGGAELAALWRAETAALRAYLGARAEHEIHQQVGWPDLPELALPEPEPPAAPFGPLLDRDPVAAARFEDLLRPAEREVLGGNWEDLVTTYDEDAYLCRSLRAAPGPVLDLACGSGRWTRVLAEQLGPDRVIGLDALPDALARARQAVPRACFIEGDARDLPFPDAHLGAVNCSDALHLLPDVERVVAEVARCLHPAGTFTVSTFRRAARPFQRWMQRRHEQVFGARTFAPVELAELLTAHGLDIVDSSGPGSFLLLTARKRGPG